MGVDMLLNVGYTALLFGCAYYLVVHHLAKDILPYVHLTVNFGQFLAGTIMYTWPFIVISLLSLTDVLHSPHHSVGVTKFSDVKDGRFWVFFARDAKKPTLAASKTTDAEQDDAPKP
jgi:hypothetical protein